MKKLFIITFIAYLLLSGENIIAQEQPPKLKILSVPQYIFKHGIRMDVELPSKNYSSWWVFSPQYFIDVSNFGNSNNFGSDEFKRYEQLHGFGFSVHRKNYFNREHVDKGLYLSGGIGFQHFNILANNEIWVQINEDGLNYMQLIKKNHHVKINKVLTEAVIGFQKEITSRLYIDIYVGVGLRYSLYDQPSGMDFKLNRNTIDYGYTGTAFVGGFKVGVGL